MGKALYREFGPVVDRRRVRGIVTLALVCALAGVCAKGSVAEPSVRDDYSMPAVFVPKDFYSLSRLFIQPGNSVWRADNYAVAELERVEHGGHTWVRWHFARANDGFIPNLAYRYPSETAPLRYSLVVLNRGTEPVSLSGWGETDASRWVAVEPGEERTVTFGGQPTLVAPGVETNTEYDLYLRDLKVCYPVAQGLTVESLKTPNRMKAGKRVRITLSVQGDLSASLVDLECRDDPWVVWRITLSQKELAELRTKNELSIERAVPWYLPPGGLTVGMVVDGLRVPGAVGRTKVVNKHRPGLPRVERKSHAGRPTFFVDEEPFIWQGYATYHNISPATIEEFASSGANLFHITCAPGRHFHNVAAPTWLGGDQYGFGEVEQWATTILHANPDAKLVLRLALGLPPFWFQEHPGSRVRIRTMDGREIIWDETDSAVATLTSDAWRAQQAVALRELIAYCASRPWASQVVGFNLGGALTEEWFAWASCDDIVTPIKHFSDYSPANQEAFRKWCAKKGLPYTEIPGPELRVRPGHDLFPDDEEGRWATAYNLFLNETTAETLMYFASVVKDATARHSLVSAFFGYVILLTGEARQSDAGQFGLRQVLACEDIDYLSGVPQFAFRHLTGVGYASQPTAVESLLAHGKQYADDNDLFSWLHDKHWHTEYDPEDPRGGCIEMHRRWLAYEAVRGNSTEWFSLSPKWHRDDQLMAEYALEASVLRESVDMNRAPVEEVAFLVDDHTFSWLTPDSQAHYPVQFLMGALGRTGAPLGTWILSDIDRLPERIRFVVVVNADAARDEDLEKLRSQIARGGRTFLVVGTPGLVSNDTLRRVPQRPGKLLDMPIQVEEGPQSGRARLASGAWLCTMKTAMQSHGRDPETIQPRASLEGAGFLFYDDGKVAGGERPLPGGGRLIWCGVPPYASEAWLRERLEEAGVHCYAPPPCSVHASEELVAITSVFADDRDIELTWPEEVIVKDLLNDWQGRGKTTTCPFSHGQTRLFRVSKP